MQVVGGVLVTSTAGAVAAAVPSVAVAAPTVATGVVGTVAAEEAGAVTAVTVAEARLRY